MPLTPETKWHRKFCPPPAREGFLWCIRESMSLGKEMLLGMEKSKRRALLLYVLAAMAITTLGAQAQDRSQGRSMVISRGGIVAAESPLAAQAGVRILERGGNAVDAAIATNAMMGVVEPMMNGIGGDLFVIVYDAKANKLYGLNAGGWAPKGLTIEYLQKQGIRSMPQQGVNAITVPGAVDGWQKLADKFGRKKLAEDLAAAIRTAQDGFPVPEWTAAYWAAGAKYFAIRIWRGRCRRLRSMAGTRFTKAKLPRRFWSR